MPLAQTSLFVAVISLPLLLNLAGGSGADPGAENRELAPFPRLERSWTSVAAFPSALDRWFADHFGLRSDLVRWQAASRFYGLRASPSASVVRGTDGWLFYADDGGLDDYVNRTPLTGAELAAWRETTARVRDWLAARHIDYLFVIAPDKHAVYPERFTPALRRVGAASRTDQVLAAIDGLAVAVDVRPALREAKQAERLYHRTDTHWNDAGAFAAYRAIIEEVRRREPRVPPAWPRADFTEVARITSGKDLARMMGLGRVLQEEELTLVPLRPRQARVVEPPGALPTDEVGHLLTEMPGSNLPRAVVFRDSFTSALVPFLSEHFSRVLYVWQNDFDADIVAKENPDVVIQQIVGRHLYTFLPTPALVPVR
jgi:hypothetical protein